MALDTGPYPGRPAVSIVPAVAQVSSLFDRAFALVILGQEGGYQCMRDDPGNWTGRAVGAGVLRGTKFGISAASYPTLDIAGLTAAAAAAIYRMDYWNRIAGDDLPAAIGLLLFDCAVNQGVGFAARTLQHGVWVPVDGVIGPQTVRGVRAMHDLRGLLDFIGEQRALRYARDYDEDEFGADWFRRLLCIFRHSVGLLGENHA